MKKVQLLFFISLTLFYSCASDNFFEKYYKGEKPQPNIGNSKEPQFIKISSIKKLKSIIKKGYSIIGKSSFNATGYNTAENDAYKYGKSLGADSIVYYCAFLGDRTTTETRVKYIPGEKKKKKTTTSMWGNLNLYGTTEETEETEDEVQTYQVPVTRRWYTYDAFYLRKIDVTELKIGCLWEPINEDLQQELQRNFAIFISLVYEGTSFYKADIMDSDVILEINNIKITSEEHFQELLKNVSNKAVFTIYRKGTIIKKEVLFK